MTLRVLTESALGNAVATGAVVASSPIDGVPGTYLVYFVVCVWAALGIAGKVRELFFRRGFPQPADVRMIDQFATRRELDGLKNEFQRLETEVQAGDRRILDEIKGMRREVTAQIDGIARSAHQGREAIWETINNRVRPAVAALEERTAHCPHVTAKPRKTTT